MSIEIHYICILLLIILSQALFLHTGVYLLAWTPYATFAMVWSFGNDSQVHPVVFSILELFAKSSCILTPLMNLYYNKAHRYVLPTEKIYWYYLYSQITNGYD